MLSWMFYSIVVGLLMGLAALALERSAQIRGRSTRWLWAMCMVVSVAIPFMPAKELVQPPTMHSGPTMSFQTIVPQVAATRTETSRLTLPTIDHRQTPLSEAISMLLDWSWRIGSMALALVIVASGIHLAWIRRRWDRGHMAGMSVYISKDCGPAVVGLLRPGIVVPRWLTKLPPDEQELVIAHERSHLEACDPQLLTLALCLLVCMPWNLVLWWQLRRLRAAIEIDCDARVLGLGYPVARYSETLIAIGERQSANYTMVMASYGSRSFLEQRIHTMLRKKTRHARLSALALASLGAGLAVCAAEVAPPKTNLVGETLFQQISADAQLLQSSGQPDDKLLRNQVLLMQAERIAEKLTQFIKETENQVGWIAQLPPKPDTELLRFDALRLLRMAPAITELSQLDFQGKEVMKVSRLAMDSVGSGTDYSGEAKFTETLANKIYYGPVYMRRESEPYMTLGMAGRRYDAGASVVELTLKPMWDIVQQIKVGNRGIAYVVNSEGRIIAHPDLGVAKSLRDVSSLAQVQEARATASTGLVRVARDMNNQDVAVAYARVPGPGWTVLVELPVQEWTKN